MLILWGMISCEEKIDINAQAFAPQLWVYGFVGPDSLASVMFTETQSFNRYFEQEHTTLFPKDLQPFIHTKEGPVPLTGESFDEDKYRYRASKLLPEEGDYRLSLHYKGDSISAQLPLPPKPDQKELTYELLYYQNIHREIVPREIHFVFPNLEPGKESYRLEYGYAGWRESTVYDSISQDYVLDTIYEAYSTFSEWVQNSPDKKRLKIPAYYYLPIFPEIELLADGSEVRFIPVWVILTAYSPFVEEYFRKVPLNYYQNNGDPFVEPTLMPSNIENGLGIFAAYHPSDTIWTKIYLD
ncbi:MAG: DUF4249 family protein [Bacteroidota bacterium]